MMTMVKISYLGLHGRIFFKVILIEVKLNLSNRAWIRLEEIYTEAKFRGKENNELERINLNKDL